MFPLRTGGRSKNLIFLNAHDNAGHAALCPAYNSSVELTIASVFSGNLFTMQRPYSEL